MDRWRSRQGPWTLWNIDKRDGFIIRPSCWLYRHGITANHITFAGFILNLFWIGLYEYLSFRNPLYHLFLFIIPIGLSDVLDGSAARNNDDVTPLGTIGDNFRDMLYIFTMVFIAFIDFGLDWRLVISVVVLECAVLFLKSIAFVWYCGGRYTREEILDFSFDSFQHTNEDRWYGIFISFGIPSYMVGAHYGLQFLVYAGQFLLICSLGIGVLVLIKEFLWTPTPKEKE